VCACAFVCVCVCACVRLCVCMQAGSMLNMTNAPVCIHKYVRITSYLVHRLSLCMCVCVMEDTKHDHDHVQLLNLINVLLMCC
jgi:hypothetical protein